MESFMKYFSQEDEHFTMYAVWSADWDIIGEELNEESKDTRLFYQKEDAISYAQKLIDLRQDDPFLAYVEIKECKTQVIQKLK